MIWLTIEQVKKIIYNAYVSGIRDSYLLLGDKGIGKSEGVMQLSKDIAKFLKRKWIWYDDYVADKILKRPSKYFVFHKFSLFECDASELLGIPRDKEDCVFYKPLLWAKVCSKTPSVVFLDDFTNIMEFDKRSASLRILLEKRVGFLPLHKDTIVICAGNLPEQSSLASYLPSPNVNRVSIFRVKMPTPEEWITYMNRTYGDKWDKKVGEYLKRYPSRMLEKSDPETLEQFASPRGWTKLAIYLHKFRNNKDAISDLSAIVSAIIGEKQLKEFMLFYLSEIVPLEKVEEDVQIWQTLPQEHKHMLIVELTNKEAEELIENYIKLIEYLLGNDRESFMKFYHTYDAVKKKKFLRTIYEKHRPLFEKIKEAVGHIGAI